MTGPHFRFRLQRLLDLRELAEREAAVALTTAKNVEEEARREQEVLAVQRAAAREMLMPPPGARGRVSEFRQVAVLLECLDAGVAQAEYKVSKAAHHVHQKQVQLGESVTDRRVLDRLKGRQHENWRISEERTDRALMDEIGRARFADGPDQSRTQDE